MREVFKNAGYDRFPTSSDEDYAKKICNGSKPITADMRNGFPKPYYVYELTTYYVGKISDDKLKTLAISFEIKDKEINKECLCKAIASQFFLYIEGGGADKAEINTVPANYERLLSGTIDEKMLGFPQYSGDKAWVINGQSVSAYTKGFYEKFDHVWNIRNIGKVYWHKRKLVCRSIDTQYIKVDAAKRLERTGKPDEKGTGNELGEILDYCFFEHVLGAPKILSKYEQVTAGGTYKAQSSGVHLLTIGDEKLPAYQLVYGASGIVDDIQDAIDRAFEEIASVSSGQRKERQVVDSIVMGKSFDEDTTARLKNVLLPSKVKIPVDNAYGLFIGYTLGLDADQYDNDSFRTAVQDKMRLDIQHHVQYIVDKINTLRLGKSSFYIYVLPLNDALSDKKEIMDRLLGGDE